MSAVGPPPQQTIPAVSAALGQGLATLATGGVPVAAAGATVATGAIAGGVVAIPALLSLLFPKDPESLFRIESALPAGANFRLFGRDFPDRVVTPEQALASGLAGQILQPLRQIDIGGVKALSFGARQALSFSPLVAAQGEAAIQAFLDAPVSGAQKLFQGGRRTGFEAFADPAVLLAKSNAIIARDRQEKVRLARRAAIGTALGSDVFTAISQAFGAGLIPTGALSAAARLSPEIFAAAGSTVGPVPEGFGDLPAVAPPVVSPPVTGEPPVIEEGITMPEVSTSTPGGLQGFIGDLFGAITPFARAIAPIFTPAPATPVFMPGGAPSGGGLPGFPQPLLVDPALSFPGSEFLFGGGLLAPGTPQGGGAVAAPGCIVPRITTSVRLPSRVDVPNANGTFTTFKNMGRPILWTGDLSATKRVRKVARRAKRAGG